MGIQFIQVLDAQPIGSVVCTLSDVGSPTYEFITNPGNLFALSGNQVSINAILPTGLNSIVIGDSNGNQITKTFNVTNVARYWTPGERPFSLISPANIPLPEGTIYTPLAMPASNGFNYYTGIKFYLDNPLATAPVCDFEIPASWGWPLRNEQFPMTPGFNGVFYLLNNGDTDNEAISMQWTACVSLYNFNRGSDTAATCASGAQCDILSDTGFGSLTGGTSGPLGAGAVVAGSSFMLGALMKEEFTASGAFDHMISFSMISSLCAGDGGLSQQPYVSYYPPAIAGDGRSGNALFMEGQVMAIPAGTPQPSGLSSYGVALFNACQTYGAFNNDTSGSITPYMVRLYDATQPEFTATTSWTDADIGLLIADWNKIGPLLAKTGPLLDGYLGNIDAFSTCGPQLQLIRYLNPCMTVSRDSDGATDQPQFVNPPQNLLDTASLTSFFSGTTGRVTLYGDQIGNNNFESAGSAAPIIYQSGAFENINSIPAMLFDGATNYLKSTTSTTGYYPGDTLYLNCVMEIADLNANYALWGSDTSGGFCAYIAQTTGLIVLATNTGTAIGTSTYGVPISGAVLVEIYYAHLNSAWSIWINGILVGTGSSSVSPVAGNILVGSIGPGAVDLFKGLIGAFTISGLIPSNPQYSIQQGLMNFWGPMIPVTLAQDSFTGTNGTDLASHTMNVGTGWTDQVGSHFIQSNSAEPNTLASGNAVSTFVAASNGHYQLMMTPYLSGGNVFEPQMVFRYTDFNNFLVLGLEINNGRIAVYQRAAGTFTLVGSLTTSLVSGTPVTIDLYLNSSSISFKVNGSGLTSITNSFNENATLAGIWSAKSSSPAGVCSYDNLLFTTQTSP